AANDAIELYRRDTDLGGNWELIQSGGRFFFSRDYLVVPGTRYEYRVIPFDGTVQGSPAELTLQQPLDDGTGQASVTVMPGYATVLPAAPILPDHANAFDPLRDYVFTLLPDPGPEFVAATVDVYVDELPETCDIIAQPEGLPGRDDLRCAGAYSTPLIAGTACNGPTCEVVLPGLSPGIHTFRFVITDGSGTSERAIIQDLEPWWGTSQATNSDYPAPIPYLFSDRVNTTSPNFQISQPRLPAVADSLDCNDIVDQWQAQTGRVGFWQDGETATLLTYFAGDRILLGRDILKRGMSGDSVAGTQLLSSDEVLGFQLTTDLSLPSDVAPQVAWLTPVIETDDTAAQHWTTVWLRIVDPDHDVIPSTVTLSNATDDPAVTYPAYYADPTQQKRAAGHYGWFVCRLPLLI
ncbi:MAG: hypothetical protein GY842_08100, partial [bacterium]|nr:hypothetical protein [bacterium]